MCVTGEFRPHKFCIFDFFFLYSLPRGWRVMEGCNSETTLVADHGSIAPRGLSGCPLYAERQELQTMNRILVWRKRKTSAESATRLNKRLPSLWIAPIPEVFWRGSLNAHAMFDIIPSEWWQFTGVAITSCKKIRESRRVFRTRKFFFQGAERKKTQEKFVQPKCFVYRAKFGPHFAFSFRLLFSDIFCPRGLCNSA